MILEKKYKVEEIPINKIKVTENIRSKIKDVSALMSNIKANGLIMPVGVFQEDNNYILFQGNRRLEACKKLGYKTIKAEILDKLSYEEMLFLNASENLHRENITVAEFGRVCYLLKQHGLNVDEISIRLGQTNSRVQEALSVFAKVPVKHRDDIVFVDKKNKAPIGKIPISNFSTILNFKRQFGLTDKQFDRFLEVSKKKMFTSTQLRALGLLKRNGFTFDDALKKIDTYRSSRMDVLLTDKVLQELMTSYNCKTQIELYQGILNGSFKGHKDLIVV